MTIKLGDIVDLDELAAAIEARHIKVQTHPTLPLRILNYTDRATYERAWNNATLTCRGLIVDADDVVVARPWRKWFNTFELPEGTLDFDAPVEVTEKADGSLGIGFPTPDGWAVATRGSFASEQAVHATHVLRSRYADWAPPAGWTPLWEIIFPENRIVCSYDFDDLVLLGAVEIDTGDLAGPDDHILASWPGRRTEVHAYTTLRQALAAPPRPNSEGVVIRYLDGPSRGLMAKWKTAWYVQLHRTLTGFTARRLWERAAVHSIREVHPDMPFRTIAQALHLSAQEVEEIHDLGPDWMDEVRKMAPEEFWAWITETDVRIRADVASVIREVAVVTAAMAGQERKVVAQTLASHRYRGLVFAALDGKPIAPGCWAQVRPAHEPPFRSVTEDTA